MLINSYICAVCKKFDMKRKRRLAWVLLTVCMVMLVASVFPHHHHADLTLCLHADMDACAPGCPDEVAAGRSADLLPRLLLRGAVAFR